jgi:hypothetical protein
MTFAAAAGRQRGRSAIADQPGSPGRADRCPPPSSLAVQYPARGCRVRSARCVRVACGQLRRLWTAAHSSGLGAYVDDGGDQVPGGTTSHPPWYHIQAWADRSANGVAYNSRTHSGTLSSRGVIPGGGVQFHAGRTSPGAIQPPGDGTRGKAAWRRALARSASASVGPTGRGSAGSLRCCWRYLLTRWPTRRETTNATSNARGPSGAYCQPAGLATTALMIHAAMRMGHRRRPYPRRSSHASR